jgi:ribonuclease Z
VKSSLRPTLVNGPFQDCALYVALRWQGSAVLMDLGRIDRLSPDSCLRLSHVCVSHTHMDHFMGFDQLLRLTLPRDRQLTFLGPPGLIDNIAGKLAGYTWNLTESYTFRMTVVERHPDHLARACFRACTGFAREPLPDVPAAPGQLVEERAFRIDTAVLDHKIPCLGFRVSESRHLNVRTEALEERGWLPGAWLAALKRAIRSGAVDETIEVTGTRGSERIAAGTLARELIVDQPGQRVAYVVDARFDPENARRIVALARDADILYSEARFLDQDRDEADKRYHLTARQAGFLARAAGVRRLEVFHFSPRYQGMAQAFRAEAQAELTGKTRLEDEEPWVASVLSAAGEPMRRSGGGRP